MMVEGSAAPTVNQRPPGPLAGVRVLDLSRLLPGPFASLVLADLGASVDKIEDTGAGDYLRAMPPLRGRYVVDVPRAEPQQAERLPRPEEGERARGAAQDGRALRRAPRAVPPGRARSPRPLARRRCSRRNPRLVVCALTGYGQDGPLAQRAGHDLNYLARAGVLGMTGPAGRGRRRCRAFSSPTSAEGSGASSASSPRSIDAAPRCDGRRRGGLADRRLDARELDGASRSPGSGSSSAAARAGARRRPAHRRARALRHVRHEGRTLRRASRALEPKFWNAFCAGAGLQPDMTALFPGPHQAALKETLRALFASRTRDEWEAFATRARLLPRAGPRAGRAPRRRAAPRARRVLRDRLALGPHRAAADAAHGDGRGPRAAAAPGRAHRRDPARGGDRRRDDRRDASRGLRSLVAAGPIDDEANAL